MKQEEARPANVTDVGLWKLVQSVRARHQRDEAGGCAFCSQAWPCEAEQRAMVADVAARMPLRPPMPRRAAQPTTGEQWGSRAPLVVASVVPGAHAAPDVAAPAAGAPSRELSPSLPAALAPATPDVQLPTLPAQRPAQPPAPAAQVSAGVIAPTASAADVAAAATVLLATVVPAAAGAESADQPVQAITTLPPMPQRVHQLIADAKSQSAPSQPTGKVVPAQVVNSPLSSRSTPDAAVISPRPKPSPTTRRQARPVPAVTVPQPKAAPSKAAQSRGRAPQPRPRPSPNLTTQRRQARAMSALPPAAPNAARPAAAKAATPAERGADATQAVPTLRRATRSQRRAG